MTQAHEQTIIRKSPLDDVHARFNARMIERDGWSVPLSYDNDSLEYGTVRDRGAGIIDLSSRGRVHVTGSESVQFLNGLITNDIKTLAINQWMNAAFPNVQGRLLASVRVLRLRDGDNGAPNFVIETDPLTHDVLLSTLNRFTLAGDFRVTDLSETALMSMQGKEAQKLMGETLGDTIAAIERHSAREIDWSGTKLTVIRASHTSENGFDIIVEARRAGDLWDALVNVGARPVGFKAFETLRIEAGESRYGTDMDETNVVSETNLDDAVSFTKGCYIGQEIIARIKYRGHVAKKLTGIKFAIAANLTTGAKLLSRDEKEIGRLTSVAFSPHLNCVVALGYVKFDYLAAGTPVKVFAGEQSIEGTVSELPFIRGSWYESS